jgi:TonB family protein
MTLNDFIVFIYESGICLAVLFTMYWLFLRRETYFRFNRFYLFSIIVVAFTLPLINLGLLAKANEQSTLAAFSGIAETIRIPEVTIAQGSGNASQFSNSWQQWALVIYLAGASLLLARMLLGILRVTILKTKSERIYLRGYSIVYMKQKLAPFSFFRTIFLNNALIDGPDKNSIIDHELVHIRQRHTYDNLFVELFLAVFWFNPFMWFLRGALRNTHEYLADQGALNERLNPVAYQTLLLKQTIGFSPVVLASSFNSSIKNRIIMMCKNKSSVLARFKPLLLVPVLATLFLIFACNENTKGQTLSNSQTKSAREGKDTKPRVMPPDEVLELNFPDEVYMIDRGPVQPDLETGAEANSETVAEPDIVPQDTIPEEHELFYVVDEMPTFNDGDPAVEFRKFIAKNLQYPESAARDSISGRVIVQFAVTKEGKVVDPVVVRSVSPELDQEAIRVIQSSPKWTPGKQRGKEVEVLFTFPINFVLQ